MHGRDEFALLSEVEQVANRVAIIEHGRMLVQDELRNLIHVSNDQYTVEVEGAADPLPFFTETARTDTRVEGWVPVRSFYPFIEACQQQNARVVQCALRKTTLEESFLSALGSLGSAHA